ncbi:MAG: RDD family protein [Verrucomicrobia bacterium]|nr:RDD family protein [Verrucomicrobiota bacterium]
MKREKHAAAPSGGIPPLSVPGVAFGTGAVAGAGVGIVSDAPVGLSAEAPAFVPAAISAATLPRAGFWIRVAALLLDAILLGIIVGILHRGGPTLPLLLAAYGAVMWKMKGTTIGGIVCGLKVVRIDGREIDWATAIVRALGCFLSLAVVGLGFIWVAFDDEKQSWHDKIAGTTVVRMPKGVSLL